MRARLFCPVGELQLNHTFGTEVTLGRSPENSLVLPQEVLSGHHLRVSWNAEDQGYVLEDLGSSNGTRLDGAWVREPQPLGHLHLITLAEQFHLVFQDLDRCAARHGQPQPGSGATAPEKTMMMSLPIPIPGSLQGPTSSDSQDKTELTVFERLPLPLPTFLRRQEVSAEGTDLRATAAPKTRKAQPGPSPAPPPPDRLSPAATGVPAGASPSLFLAVEEEEGIQHYPLPPGRHVLGRGRQANLQIPSPHLSRTHAVLTVEEGRVSLRDEGSKNSTYVDGSRLLEELVVEPGQEIAFGLLKARLVVLGGEKDREREAKS